MTRVIQALADFYTPFSILTNNTLISRDAPLLLQDQARVALTVTFSLTTTDPALAHALEPDIPPPIQRLGVAQNLNAMGIPTGIALAPVLPGITDSEENLRARIGAVFTATPNGAIIEMPHSPVTVVAKGARDNDRQMMHVPTPPASDNEQPRYATEHARPHRQVVVLTPEGWFIAHTDLPTVSVLVPVLNEARDLRTCLDCIFNQDYPPELVEVLVIDGGSVDGTREIVSAYRHRHPNLRLLVNPEGTPATALNRGLQAASGEIIVRVDGHTFIAPDYIQRCVAALESDRADAVGGVVRRVGDTPTAQAIAIVLSHPLSGNPERPDSARRRGWTNAVAMGAWRKETLQRLGGFDPRLAANENEDLFYRLRQAGGRILCDPNIRAWTTTSRTYGQLWQHYSRLGFWKAHTLKEHPDCLRLRYLPAPLLVLSVSLLWVLSWHFPWASSAALLLLLAYSTLTAALATALSLHKGWQFWWRLWVALGVMHWAWGVGFLRGLLSPRGEE